MLAELAPVAGGVNEALIEQVPLTAILEPHVLVDPNALAFVPVTVTELIVSADVPEFVIVIVCARLVVPLL